jgi:hypothetical protein
VLRIVFCRPKINANKNDKFAKKILKLFVALALNAKKILKIIIVNFFFIFLFIN